MEAQKRSPRVYIDLTDVILHATWYPTLGGIARVQLEVAIALLRLNPAAIPFSFDNGAWRDLRPLIESARFDSDEIFAALHEHFFFRREAPALARSRIISFGSRKPMFMRSTKRSALMHRRLRSATCSLSVAPFG